MMKSVVAGLAFLAAGTIVAAAEDRVIIHGPGIAVEERDRPIVEKRTTIESERHGCDTKTVHKEGPEGSKTVTKERCD
jgi:hypothetical protein